MIDVDHIGRNLVRDPDGVWVARDAREVSYPSTGNEWCLEIEDGSFWFRHRNRVITELVERFSPHGPLFDVGGGNGFVSKGLQDAGFDAVLVEPGSGARNAHARGLDCVVQSTLEDVGFEPGSVDAFGLFDVLEHIEHERDFLDTLESTLKPGGRLYLTVPAYRMLWSYDDVFAGHFRRYSTRSLQRTLEECGFTVRYCSYLFAPLVPAVLLLRAVPTWIRLRNSVTEQSTGQDHTAPVGIAGRMLERLLDYEFGRILTGRTIPTGTSCIAVAERVRGSADATGVPQRHRAA